MSEANYVETTPSIRAASRKTRVYVFRDFVRRTYQDYLQKGDVVLDMAGGKGDLSWLLRNVDDIDSIVVDPRITKKRHIVKSIQYLRAHPEQARERAIPNLPTYQPLAALLPKMDGKETFESPGHLRLLVDEDLVRAVEQYKADPATSRIENWDAYWEHATAKAREALPLGYKEEAVENTPQSRPNSEQAIQAILATKLIMGFHPDQATDSALDLANVLGIPYCVVPCCVFPKEFPNRSLSDGSRVRSYSQLIQYLLHKHKSTVNKGMLDFHFTETAKNIVLYSLPKTNHAPPRE